MRNTLLKMGFTEHPGKVGSLLDTVYVNQPYMVQQHPNGWSISKINESTFDNYEILFRGMSAKELTSRLYIIFRDNFTDDLLERILVKNGFTKYEGGIYRKGPWLIYQFSTGGWEYAHSGQLLRKLTFQILMDVIINIHGLFVEEPKTVNLDQLKISNLNFQL